MVLTLSVEALGQGVFVGFGHQFLVVYPEFLGSGGLVPGLIQGFRGLEVHAVLVLPGPGGEDQPADDAIPGARVGLDEPLEGQPVDDGVDR